MARDVVACVGGLDRDGVFAMLGKPDARLDSTTDASGHQLHGSEVFSYSIGSWSLYGMDDAFIYVHFDSRGGVIYSEITGY